MKLTFKTDRAWADEDYYLDISDVLNNECGEFDANWGGECVDEYGDEGSERGNRI
jgi:hypothetical protein